MHKTTEEKAKDVFTRHGEVDGEKHIMQCLYFVDHNLKLTDYWSKVLSAFYILIKK